MDNQQQHTEFLELIEAEKAALKKRLDSFYSGSDQSIDKYNEVNDDIIASLERLFEICSKGEGADSAFLKNTLQPLRDTYERAKQFKSDASPSQVENEKKVPGLEAPEGRELVYITLYMSNGHELSRWGRQLKSLASLMLTRPIYRNESDAKSAVREKSSDNTEAYVVVAVEERYIVDVGRSDRRERPIVSLDENAIDDPKYILQFILSGKCYHYIDGKLVEDLSNSG